MEQVAGPVVIVMLQFVELGLDRWVWADAAPLDTAGIPG